jgi:hypothetical protein
MKEQMLRTLATKNARTCRNEIKQLRIKLKAHVMQNIKTKTQATILSCTAAGKTYYQNQFIVIIQPPIIIIFMVTNSR